MKRFARIFAGAALLFAVLAAVMLGALFVGSSGGAFGADQVGGVDLSARAVSGVVLNALFGLGPPPESAQLLIVLRIRLPEVLLAASVGSALAVSGSLFQTTLRNPLADPLLLGVASGASLAASIAIGLGATGGLVPSIAATLGAGATLIFVFLIAGRRGRFDPGTMVLAGVIASTFYSALTLFLLAVTPSQAVSDIIHWTMGSFVDIGFEKVRWAGPALVALSAAAAAGARPLNVMMLGDDVARSSGLALGRARALLYAAAALLTGVAVAAAGVVGFVGLVVPHVARRLFGADQRTALPASALLGAILCVVSDAVARVCVPITQILWAHLHGLTTHAAPAELPVGVITALFGAPFFLFLLVRSGGEAT